MQDEQGRGDDMEGLKGGKNMKLKMQKITVKRRVTKKHSVISHHDQLKHYLYWSMNQRGFLGGHLNFALLTSVSLIFPNQHSVCSKSNDLLIIRTETQQRKYIPDNKHSNLWICDSNTEYFYLSSPSVFVSLFPLATSRDELERVQEGAMLSSSIGCHGDFKDTLICLK